MLKKKIIQMLEKFLKPSYNKKGALEIETLIKWAIILAILVVLVIATTVLLKGKGGTLLESLKESLRFGGI